VGSRTRRRHDDIAIAEQRLSDRERQRNALGGAALVRFDDGHELLGERQSVHAIEYTEMHQYAWICDHCDLDEHTPMSRADPPAGWYVVTQFQDGDDAEPTEHHFCSHRCQALGPMPADVRAANRREALERQDP
jgi:hypothetical protein